MSDLEEEAPVTEEPLVRKGRPTGRPDATQRKRRTAQEISDDKIIIAQMKLDTLKETEARKLAHNNNEHRRHNNAYPNRNLHPPTMSPSRILTVLQASLILGHLDNSYTIRGLNSSYDKCRDAREVAIITYFR